MNVELVLNLIWVLIALLAFGWVGIWAREQRDRRHVTFIAIATGCVVALLFPVISITDDLQTTTAALEETVAVRRILEAPSHQLAAVIAAPVVALCVLNVLTFLGVMDGDSVAFPVSRTAPVFSLRGPPFDIC